MKLHVIPTGMFKLDGGAMFGVVPRSLWQGVHQPDSKGLCTWAMRCLLIEDGEQLMLIDTGLGNKQDPKFFSHYEPHGEDSLHKSLKAKGFSPNDITDVFLTHLHFDHCGGAVERQGDRLHPTFPRARYWSNEKHWQWASEPNAREKASFLKENFEPIQASGQLSFLQEGEQPMPGVQVYWAHGHTESQMIPMISYRGHTVVFMADLLPSVGHIPLPWVMAYDTRPLLTLTEKKSFLQEATDEQYILFFEHDPIHEACTLVDTPKGPRLGNVLRLNDL